jgi:hypothetical protein
MRNRMLQYVIENFNVWMKLHGDSEVRMLKLKYTVQQDTAIQYLNFCLNLMCSCLNVGLYNSSIIFLHCLVVTDVLWKVYFVFISMYALAHVVVKFIFVRFEVSTAVTMMIIIFWEMIIIKFIFVKRAQRL